jgi:uncharacterized protein YceH (UPF0502 family)
MELNPVEGRIIGSLAEKQLTTPQQYPLTLNALVLACNQSSNRDPVVAYGEGTVESALSGLKEAGLVRFVHPSHGRSVTRYRQVIDERFGLDDRGLSIVAVLLLRGPQTVGELRARTERMAEFDGLGPVEAELDRLASGPEPLVRRLERLPGQKEERWVQLLTGEPAEQPARAAPTAAAPGTGSNALGPDVASPRAGDDPSLRADEIASLRAEVDSLRFEVADLKTAVDELRSALGG